MDLLSLSPNQMTKGSTHISMGAHSVPLTNTPQAGLLPQRASEGSCHPQRKAVALIEVFLPGTRADGIMKALGLCFYFTRSIKL